MAVIGYSSAISVFPINKQLFGEKSTCAKFQFDISKTSSSVRVCKETNMAKLTLLVTLIRDSDDSLWVF